MGFLAYKALDMGEFEHKSEIIFVVSELKCNVTPHQTPPLPPRATPSYLSTLFAQGFKNEYSSKNQSHRSEGVTGTVSDNFPYFSINT